MVCFGYGPNWSIQFLNGEARYLGINQPDQYFVGDFYWLPEQKDWSWHRTEGEPAMHGNFGLSATIKPTACKDAVRKQTFPYSAQINLPQGDIVNGCCRRLKPGEAPVGRHGVTPVPQQQQGQPPAQNPPPQ